MELINKTKSSLKLSKKPKNEEKVEVKKNEEKPLDTWGTIKKTEKVLKVLPELKKEKNNDN
jgi:hypothetical protein